MIITLRISFYGGDMFLVDVDRDVPPVYALHAIHALYVYFFPKCYYLD